MEQSIKMYPGSRAGDAVYFYKEYELHRIEDLTMLRADVKDAFECIHVTGQGKKCNFKLYRLDSPNRVFKSLLVVWYGGFYN
jgi:hypothetical protein